MKKVFLISIICVCIITAIFFNSCAKKVSYEIDTQEAISSDNAESDAQSDKTATTDRADAEQDVLPVMNGELRFVHTSDGRGYSVSGKGTVTGENIVVPETYNGKPVLEIGNGAFYTNCEITTVILPKSIEIIEDYAFYGCENIKTLTMSHGVTKIGDYAFDACYRLSTLVIPDSVTHIGSVAFAGCRNLVSVVVGKNVEKISSDAFLDDKVLVEVINRSKLNISVGTSSYGRIAEYAKEVHTGFSKIIKQGDFMFYKIDGTNYLLAYTGKEETVFLPNLYSGETYEIYSNAFYFTNDISNVVISDGVTKINESAFNNCFNLMTVTVGKNVEDIADYAFKGCHIAEVINHSELRIIAKLSAYGGIAKYAVEVHTGNSNIVKENDYLFYNGNQKKCMLRYLGTDAELILPENYNMSSYEIFTYCFSGNKKIKNVVIPDCVTKIGDSAFFYCDSLTNVTIGKGVKKIGQHAFYWCDSLTDVTFKNTDGWYQSTYSSSTGGTEIPSDDIKDNAAKCLTETYVDKYLYQN